MQENSYPYPGVLPACLREDALESYARKCPPCPYQACGYLATAQAAVERDQDNAQLRRDLESEKQWNINATQDDLVPGFLRTGGIDYAIRSDADFAQEIAGGDWAIIMGDLRNVKEVNDNIGHRGGDNLIYAAGKRMLKLCQQSRRRSRHQTPSPDTDIGIREGHSDELGILVRQITPRQAVAVYRVIARRFSIEGAVNDDRAEVLPILGTFLTVHARKFKDLFDNMDTYYTAKSMLNLARNTARERLHILKVKQYADMWRHLNEVCIQTNQPAPPLPSDARMIAFMFREFCLPNYTQNQEHLLRHAGPHMGSG